MPGYVIANYTIKDSEAFEKYPPAVGPTLQQYGGRLLVADRGVRAMEGSPQPVIVVVEFESVEADSTIELEAWSVGEPLTRMLTEQRVAILERADEARRAYTRLMDVN